MIGPVGEKSFNSFDFEFCNPAWFEKNIDRDGKGYMVGYHRIILNNYTGELGHSIISQILSRISGDSWEVLARKISRYGRWEFEDYIVG